MNIYKSMGFEWLLEKDIFAADLYEQVLAQKNRTIPRNEYTREIVLL